MWSGASEETTNLQIEVENLQDFLSFEIFCLLFSAHLAEVKSIKTRRSRHKS